MSSLLLKNMLYEWYVPYYYNIIVIITAIIMNSFIPFKIVASALSLD